ncbi:hypothetical protein [Pectinatus brassicae]|uniref:LPS-assembly protein n=1 Tax=Pectinatus brassicae TaxID=862415 RepID=A0A840USJ5_9FIRM|nr:hypothetical protein [Pectinatus brassicae]MBB5335933.1 LPS-assembly protein [Pectinatus brassicae]
MQKRIHFLSIMAVFATAFSIGQPYVHADDTDTDVQLLNYIQDQKDYQRQLLATKELRELRDEINKEKFIRPIDPNKPAPIIFEGKDISYDSKTGDVYAKGDVKVTNKYSRLTTDLMTGNSVTGNVTIKDKAHIAQYEGPSVLLDGYNTQYNYNSQKGKMENAKGSINLKYISGEKIEFYPEEMIIYNGTITKCPAKKPDYHMSADKIEIWPDDHMVAYNAKFWIKGQVVYKKDRYITKIGKNATNNDFFIPVHVKYDSDDGVHIQYYYDKQLNDKINAYIDFNYYSKHDLRNIYGIRWADGKASLRVEDGYYEDSNDRWLKKEPTTIFTYNTPIGNTPLNFGFTSEYGKWTEDGITSWHRSNTISLSHKPINLGSSKIRLYPNIGYSWVNESYDNSSYNSLFYNATIMADISPRLIAYTAYHYSQSTTQNALFDYGFDDYSQKVTAGFSYELTNKDRIVIANEFDAGNNMELEDRDYYWYHDFHCFDMALEYREKRQSWHVHFDLVHW